MKLNVDLIRSLLISIEDITNGTTNFSLSEFTKSEPLNRYSQEEIRYHADQISQNGLIHATPNSEFDFFFIRDLTPYGHEFISNIRNNDVWTKIKEEGKKLGLEGLHHFIKISTKIAYSYLADYS